MITQVTGKNQITIPAELAREMEIGPGTRLDWTKSGAATLSARVIPDRAVLAKRLAGRGKRYLRRGSDPIAALIEERRNEDREEGVE